MIQAVIATVSKPPIPGNAKGWQSDSARLYVEIRADQFPGRDPQSLAPKAAFPSIYSLRGQWEGGGFTGSLAERHALLQAAATRFDCVELELGRDTTPALLGRIPVEKRILSWHGPAIDLDGLMQRFGAMSATPAKWYKLVTWAEEAWEALPPIQLLRLLQREDVIAFAEGPGGCWTRPFSALLGAPAVYGMFHGDAPELGAFSIARLKRDYGLPTLPTVKKLFAIAGARVFDSPSPWLHNAGYRASGTPAWFLPLPCRSMPEFWEEFIGDGATAELGFPLAGLTVVAPLKDTALEVASGTSPVARLIRSANLLVQRDGSWHADSTDPDGILLNLRERGIDPKGKTCAVLGRGGTGRAVAAALSAAGARVTLVNRNETRGRQAARQLEIAFEPLASWQSGRYDMVVHATPMGRDGVTNPLENRPLKPDGLVADHVLRPGGTPMIADAAARGIGVIDGIDVLLAQVSSQFQAMTGRPWPREIGRDTVVRGWSAASLSGEAPVPREKP